VNWRGIVKAKGTKKIGSSKGASGVTELVANNTDTKDSESNGGGSRERSVLKKKGYLAESVVELKKVSFPTRQETIRTSIWTVLFVLFFSLVLAVFDLSFQYLMKALLAI
jgi:preprotein translocase subunit SecE